MLMLLRNMGISLVHIADSNKLVRCFLMRNICRLKYLFILILLITSGCTTTHSTNEYSQSYQEVYETAYNNGYEDGYSAGFSDGLDDSYIYDTDIYNKGVLMGIEYAMDCIPIEKLSEIEKESLDEYYNTYYSYVYGENYED